MREGQFIKRNKERWAEYEQPVEDPDELARRFTNLVDDLAYAKTFYPAGNTVRYINTLASNIYLSIYRNRKEKGRRIITFWTTELPLIMFRYRKTLLYAFLFFMAFVMMGVLSASSDQSFARSVLGDGYVDTTEQNIASGKPFGVYDNESEFIMFLRIALNNLGVAFNCFILGLTCSVGTIYYMFRNGLMLGVFEQMFAQHGLGVRFFLVVFIHGTLEISAMVIAAAAGLVLGNSILFPGTYTRIQSLQRGVKDGLKIMIGLIPVWVMAAFFEGFVTRHTNMPLAASLFILFGSLTYILFYFVIYPWLLNRKLLAHATRA